MTDADPPMPTGTTVAPGPGGQEGHAVVQVGDDRAGPALPLGEQDEHLAGLEHLLGLAERFAVGRLAVHRKGAEGGEEAGQQADCCHRLSLAM